MIGCKSGSDYGIVYNDISVDILHILEYIIRLGSFYASDV